MEDCVELYASKTIFDTASAYICMFSIEAALIFQSPSTSSFPSAKETLSLKLEVSIFFSHL